MTIEKKKILYKFVKFVKDTLNIQTPFSLKISYVRTGFKTFAYYNPSEKLIAVYVKDRALPDILRSIAHELVHHFDYQTGLAKKQNNPDVGIFNSDEEKTIVADDIENRANAIAGSLIKKFGYDHPELDLWDN